MKHSNCKRFLSLLFAFILMVAPLMNCGILKANAATSLADMDFSSSNTDRSDGDGWNFVPGNASMTPVSATLEGESQYVLKLVKSDTDASFCDFYLPTDADKAYTVSFWLKIEGTTTGVFEVTAPVSPVYPDAPGDQYTLSCVYQNGAVYKEQITNTNDSWKKFSFTFTQVEGNDRIRFLFPMQSTEYTCYLGGLKVVEAETGNYFSNGDFLTHNGNANYAGNISNVLGNHISWMSNAGNCTAETVMVDRNGTEAAALKLVSVDGGFNNLTISTKEPLTPGDYNLSYWMKVDTGIDAQPGMMFNDTACYEAFPDGTPYNCYIGGDGVWRQFSYTFTLDDSAASYATQMYFRFFHTAGTVYLSDLSLTECHEHSYTAAVTAPTCNAQGYTTYTCSCGDSYIADYVNATGEHSFENDVCTGCGESVFTFSNTDWAGGLGWHLGNIGTATVTDATATLDGVEQTVKTITDSSSDNTFFDLYYPMEGGSRYTVSFWLKIEGTTTGIFEITTPEAMAYPNAPGDQWTVSCVYQNNTVYKEQIASTNDSWKKFSFTFTNPEGGTRLRFFFPYQDTEYTCSFGGVKIAAADESNLFANGSFLTHNGGNYASNISNVLGNHISWVSNAGNCTAQTVTVDRNGTEAAALKLVSVDGNFNNLAISTKQALTPGTYVLSYWMKAETGIDAQTGMEFNGTTYYAEFPDGTAYNCYVTGDGVWRQYSYTFTLDDSAESYTTKLYLRYFSAAGTVYLSDLSLTECHVHSYTSVVTAPTCNTQGYTTYTCACGDSYIADYVDATGEHSFENEVCTACGDSVFAFSNTNWKGALGWHLGNIGTATVTNGTATLDGVEQTVKTVTDSSSDNTFFDFYYPMNAGGCYTVSFWLKIEGTTTGIFEITTPEAMAYPNAPGDQWTISCVYQNNTVYKEQIASTNDSWKKFSFTFTNPEGGTRLRFFFPYQDTQYTCSFGGVKIAAADERNLFANGDFLTHNGTNYAGNVTNVLGNHVSWVSNYDNCTAETVMVDRNGVQASALKVVATEGTFRNISIATKQALTPGEYTLSYWLRADSSTATTMDVQTGMEFNGTTCYAELPDGTAYNCYAGGDGNWRQFSYTFTLDDSAESYTTKLYLRMLGAPGTVYLSDLSLICNTPENPVSEWNLSLGDNIGVNFVMNVAETDVVSFTVAGNAAEAVKSGNTYSISLAAAQMTDEIVISVNGEALEKTYSVRQYADYILNAENGYSEKEKALVKEMLNYGAKAQTYFSYNVDNLANAGITDAGAEAVSANAAPEMAVSGSVDGISFYGASLVFRNKIAVRYYFTVTGDISGYTFTVNGQAYTPVLKDGVYYIEVADIDPQELGNAITVLVNGTLSVSYSPMNYIVRMSTKGSENLQGLMQALYNYYLKAVAYTAV